MHISILLNSTIKVQKSFPFGRARDRIVTLYTKALLILVIVSDIVLNLPCRRVPLFSLRLEQETGMLSKLWASTKRICPRVTYMLFLNPPQSDHMLTVSTVIGFGGKPGIWRGEVPPITRSVKQNGRRCNFLPTTSHHRRACNRYSKRCLSIQETIRLCSKSGELLSSSQDYNGADFRVA